MLRPASVMSRIEAWNRRCVWAPELLVGLNTRAQRLQRSASFPRMRFDAETSPDAVISIEPALEFGLLFLRPVSGIAPC